VAFQFLKGSYRKEGNRHFSRVCCDRTRGDGLKLKECRFRLDMSEKCFTVRVVRCLHRLPSVVVDTLFLETFKARLDQALGSLMQLWMSLCIAGELD